VIATKGIAHQQKSGAGLDRTRKFFIFEKFLLPNNRKLRFKQFSHLETYFFFFTVTSVQKRSIFYSSVWPEKLQNYINNDLASYSNQDGKLIIEL